MLDGINLVILDKVLLSLYIVFICLNALDLGSTTLALAASEHMFQEYNVLAAKLFSMDFVGFILALIIKHIPIFLFFFVVFVKDSKNRYPYQIRIVKTGGLAALVIGDLFYGWIVLFNNIPLLIMN